MGIGTTFESGSSMLSARYQGDAPAANVAPTARYAFSCSGLTCYLDARTSSDPDGPVAGYRWDFSDGTSATGSYVRKVFAQWGTYSATLTVTDGSGATGTQARTLTLLRLTATGCSSAASLRPTLLERHPRHHLRRLPRRQTRRADQREYVHRPAAVRGLRHLQLHRLRSVRPLLLGYGDRPIPSRVRQAVQPAGRFAHSGYLAR